jgi:pimeloyl-ACP methyl ester carboxylesterase
MWNPRYDIKLDTRLARILAPTLVLAPEEDRVAGGAAARFAELIPGARLAVVPGSDGHPSSHGLVLEQPSAVVDRIVGQINGGS